jgi:hypothetical protein
VNASSLRLVMAEAMSQISFGSKYTLEPRYNKAVLRSIVIVTLVKLLATFVVCFPLLSQTFQIVPSLAPSGGAGSLLVTFNSQPGKEPVALQWKITLGTEVTAAAGDFIVGDAAKLADKAVVCAPATKPAEPSLTYGCILSGGTKPVANGTIFLLKYKVKEKAAPHTVVVRISEGMAVSGPSNHLQTTKPAPAEGTITIR